MPVRMPPAVQDAWRKLVTAERTASTQYYQFGIDACELSLFGFAHWFKDQAHEETHHAKKILHFLKVEQVQVVLEALPAPKSLGDVAAMIQASVDLEAKVTDQINSLYWLAYDQKHAPSVKWIKWLILNQSSSERGLRDIQARMKLATGTLGLLEMDKEMGKT